MRCSAQNPPRLAALIRLLPLASLACGQTDRQRELGSTGRGRALLLLLLFAFGALLLLSAMQQKEPVSVQPVHWMPLQHTRQIARLAQLVHN